MEENCFVSQKIKDGRLVKDETEKSQHFLDCSEDSWQPLGETYNNAM
jgi:hypothetical protein